MTRFYAFFLGQSSKYYLSNRQLLSAPYTTCKFTHPAQHRLAVRWSAMLSGWHEVMVAHMLKQKSRVKVYWINTKPVLVQIVFSVE